MLRLYASDPLYADWSRLLTLRAAFVNGIAWDMQVMTEGERAVCVEAMSEEVAKRWEELTR